MVEKKAAATGYKTDNINTHNDLEHQGFHCIGSSIVNGKEVWEFAETKAEIEKGTPGGFLVKKPSQEQVEQKTKDKKK